MYDKEANVKYSTKVTKYSDEHGDTEVIETEIYKKYYGGPHFYRVWLSDLLYHLNLISNSRQMDVLFYVLDNVNSDNIFIGTNRDIAEKTKASTKTVNAILKKMVENDLMTIVQRGVYMVKPTLLVKGDNIKKRRLTIEYEELEQAAKAEAEAKAKAKAEKEEAAKAEEEAKAVKSDNAAEVDRNLYGSFLKEGEQDHEYK